MGIARRGQISPPLSLCFFFIFSTQKFSSQFRVNFFFNFSMPNLKSFTLFFYARKGKGTLTGLKERSSLIILFQWRLSHSLSLSLSISFYLSLSLTHSLLLPLSLSLSVCFSHTHILQYRSFILIKENMEGQVLDFKLGRRQGWWWQR